MLRAGPYPKDVSQCQGCGVDVVWMRTKRRKWIMANVMVVDNSDLRGPNAGEDRFKYGEHQSHFATCPEAGSFRRGSDDET